LTADPDDGLRTESDRRRTLVADALAGGVRYYCSLGIPNGVVVNLAGTERAGSVRRGGRLESLDRDEYGLWLLLLTPHTWTDAVAAAGRVGVSDADAVLRRLVDSWLVVSIVPGTRLDGVTGRLRPIPTGMGVGNVGPQPTEFGLADRALKVVATVDAIGAALWSEFDGATLLQTAVAAVAQWWDAPPADIDAAATWLVWSLLAHRLAYIDTTTPAGGVN
jgi:hypothetical protein